MADVETAEQREDRERMRVVFDTAADDYEAGRAGYPDELLARLLTTAAVTHGGRVLEVGCGTGQLLASWFATACRWSRSTRARQ